MLSTKKPRFNFQLTINDLSNIPQISGNCYIEITIRNSNSLIKPLRVRTKFSKFDNGADNDDDDDNDDTEDGGDGDEPSKSFSAHDKNRGCTGIIKGSTVAAITSKKKIHNFKCVFNFNLSCNLKFPYKKSQNLIGNKFLSLKVYYNHDNEDSLMGKTEINLSEYLNFNEPVTSKYLLKDSKINSILSLTIDLSELPANMDFHTQLLLNDNWNSNNSVSSLIKDIKPNSFNLPQFDRQKIFGGFNNALIEEQREKEPFTNNPPLPSSPDSDKKKNCFVKSTSDKFKSGSNLTNSTMNSGMNQELLPVASQTHTQPGVVMDPIVSGLYRKILESTWDPELLPLLDYTPEKCINDIFNNSDNPKGWCPNIKQDNWDNDEDDDGLKNLNGLINESKLRDDLRSWVVEMK